MDTFSPPRQTTDVTKFFKEITEKYLALEKSTHHLIINITDYSHQQLFDECNKLAEHKNKIAIMDQQMFDIIDLAGKELAHSPLVQDYRIAFAKANMACSNLYEQLNILKTTLLREQQPSFSNTCA